MHRRQFLKAGSVMLASSLMPIMGCDQESQHASNDPLATIRRAMKRLGGQQQPLKILYPKGSYDNLEVVINDFENAFSIKIEAIASELDDIAAEIFLNVNHRNQQYDVALPPTFNIPDLADAGVIVDLSDYAYEYEPKNYFSSSLYRTGDHYDGQLYGYQADGDAYMLFYNKQFYADTDNQKKYEDLYQTQLTLPKQWDELSRQIKFFHQPDNGLFGGSLFRNKNYIAWEFWVRLHAVGLLPFSNELQPMIDHPLAIEELAKMVELNPYLEKGVHQNGLFANFESFAKGDKFCNFGWGGTQKYIVSHRSRLVDNLAYSPTLSYGRSAEQDYMPCFNWGWNYVVLSNSVQKELAYLFCLFAASVKQSTNAVAQADGYFDPHREEHYQSQAIIDLYGEDFLTQHYFSLRHSLPDFYLQGHSQYMSTLRHAIYTASQGSVSPAKALGLAAAEWKKLNQRIGEEKQLTQWQQLYNLYPAYIKNAIHQQT